MYNVNHLRFPLLLSCVLLLHPVFSFRLAATPLETIDESTSIPSTGTANWTELNNRFRERRIRGAGRGDTFCMISPGTETYSMWSDRPLFVWRNSIQSLMLNLPNGSWQPEIMPETRQVLYPQPLPPGEYTFEIAYIDRDGQQQTQAFDFEVMSASDRAQHQAALDAIEAQARTNRESADNVARRRAEYFLEQGLDSDYIQEIYAMPQSSPQRSRAAEAIGNSVCPD